MSNAFYPSFTQQLCSFGNNEIQMPISDISLSVCGGNFFHDSQVSSDQHLGSFAPLSTMEIPQSFNSLRLPDWLTNTTSTLEKTSQLHFPSRSFIPGTTTTGSIENAKKRKIRMEVDRGVLEVNKKNKAVCMDPTQGRPKEVKKAPPVRRSLKISDKITALQKLVSPYGKTDTASVLQEAQSYIKYLQEQIEMLSAPYFTVRPLQLLRVGAGTRRDLGSRGLCLVQVSFTHNLDPKDDQGGCFGASK